LFLDVLPTDQACRHVHYILGRNVTLGCDATHYCPSGVVSRAQMALFIARAIAGGDASVPLAYLDGVTGRSYDCGTVAPVTHFTDIPATLSYCRHVNYLWARAVVDGCTVTTYCPAPLVTRGQMAKFLVNGFSLRLF
jgi:hypothetical protein